MLVNMSIILDGTTFMDRSPRKRATIIIERQRASSTTQRNIKGKLQLLSSAMLLLHITSE